MGGGALARRGAAGARGARGALGAARAKAGIHPEWHPEAEVVCNGETVMKVSGTKARYDVDVYSGNHPFYKGFPGAPRQTNPSGSRKKEKEERFFGRRRVSLTWGGPLLPGFKLEISNSPPRG